MPDEILQLSEIRALLQDRRLEMVAEATGVNVRTIRNIRNGTNENPNLKTLRSLSGYFMPVEESDGQ